MAFKIKDGFRIGTVDVFNNAGVLLVDAPAWITARSVTFDNVASEVNGTFSISGDADVTGQTLSLTTTLPGGGAPNDPGTFGTTNTIPQFTVDSKGRITSITSVAATFPTFTVDADVGSFGFGGGTLSIIGGTGISTIVVDDTASGADFTVNADVATVGATAVGSTLGVASFDSANFEMTTAGWVGIAAGGVSNAELANDSVTFGATTVALGGTNTAISGLTSIDGTAGATSFFSTPTAPVLFANASTVGIGAGVSTVTINDDLVVTGDLTVNGTLTSINSTTVQVDDINIELGTTAAPTDATANGGGITLKASTDKTIAWIDATDSWTFNQSIDLLTGFDYNINNTSVLSATTLGTGVVNSSLTSVGTIATGTWQGTIIDSTYGGTGINNAGRTLTIATNNITLTADAAGSIVTLPATGTLATLAGTETLTNKTINNSVIGAVSPGAGTFTDLSVNNTFIITSVVNATSNATGALQVDGGVSVDQDIFLSGNQVYATAAGVAVGYERAVQTSISSIVATAIDTWPIATFRYAKYIIQITQGTDIQISEIRVTHDGTTTYMTEYAVLETNGPIAAAFTSQVNGANAELLVTMNTAAAASINIVRTVVVV